MTVLPVGAVAAEPDQVAQDTNSIGAYVLEEHVGFLLRRAFQRHAALFGDRMAEWGLTPTQFAALIRAVQVGRVTQNHLGRMTAMDPATIQGVVRRLIERGLLRREDDPLDRRSAVLIPTEGAHRLATEVIPTVRAVHEATLGGLSAADRRELKRLLALIG
jgi:DNA-binding MarR family transcriptional regulator